MADEPVYYQPPAEHDRHVRGMVKFLIIFFGVLVAIVAAVVINAQWLATRLPFSAEQRFADGIERSFQRWFDAPPNAEQVIVQEYLESLVDDLARHMDVPREMQLRVHILRSEQVNAFATVGGHLFVLTGLMDAVPDENSLAMVLGHEIAHIRHRDPLAGLGRGMALQILYGFVTGSSRGAGDAATYGSEIGLGYFSREQELAADRAALAALQARYGHIAGGQTLFGVLAQHDRQADSGVPDWLSTHPAIAARKQMLDALAQRRGWREGEPRAYPDNVRQALASIRKGLRTKA